uniref:Uncharacterized protein n=1 Tax=Mus spicilegus TaxID=10103 RepID=A0A8C6HL17_MUSSI
MLRGEGAGSAVASRMGRSPRWHAGPRGPAAGCGHRAALGAAGLTLLRCGSRVSRLGVEQRGPGKNCLHDHGISPARLKSMRAVLSTGMRKYVSLQFGRVVKHIRVSQ